MKHRIWIRCIPAKGFYQQYVDDKIGQGTKYTFKRVLRELQHFYAATAPAPAPSLRPKFSKQPKVNITLKLVNYYHPVLHDKSILLTA
jgi:hypothetical protein